jgi:hypothetical protein
MLGERRGNSWTIVRARNDIREVTRTCIWSFDT